jgi:hypothetical protein
MLGVLIMKFIWCFLTSLCCHVSVPRPATSGGRPSQQVCRYFPKCSNTNCRFLHPKVQYLFQYLIHPLGIKVTNLICIHKETESESWLHSQNVCYHSVQNLSSSSLLSETGRLKYYMWNYHLTSSVWVRNLVSHPRGRTQIEGAEKCLHPRKKKYTSRRMEKTT